LKPPSAPKRARRRPSDPGKDDAILTLSMASLQREIEEGVSIIKNGGVIAFPTDTVYGLGADAFNSTAVERIYEIKDRSKSHRFPLLIADVKQLTALAEPIPELAWFLATQFWPGGVTLVLSKKDSLPAYLASGSTIAVRVPNHPTCLTIVEHLARPLIGTSANISGQPPALTANEVRQQLGGRIDLIIDGGKCSGGKESTVLDISRQPPVVLRQGIIPSHEIDRAYNEYLEAK
jgi:L-threonylcarbamoyladenylate synthase